MDNATEAVIDRKCRNFEQLYRGDQAGAQYCLGTNVAAEYMCPNITDGGIEEQPLHPWFAKQCDAGRKAVCHKKQPLLGKYHLCPNQGLYEHKQTNIYKRGESLQKQEDRIRQRQLNPNKSVTTAEQKGGYVTTQHPQGHPKIAGVGAEFGPYQVFPAQEGHHLKRCIGSRNLHPSRHVSGYSNVRQPIPPSPSRPPVPPLAKKMVIESTRLPSGPQISVTGWEPPTNQLVIETPDETTRRYIMNSNITPSYYLDVSAPHIAKRAVRAGRNVESDIPAMMLKNKGNFPGRDAGCYQPHWSPNCI
jgi:hypothetical protein